MKVLEISGTAAAAYAGLLLTELGHAVDRLAAPDSLPKSATLFLHRNKVSVERSELDLTGYDAIIEDLGPAGLRRLSLSIRKLQKAAPQAVLVSLSGLGRSGPASSWETSELIDQAMGGVMHITGYKDEPPLKLPGDTAAMIAGLHGATAVIATVLGIAAGEELPVYIDISAQDTLMQHWTRHVSQYAYAGTMMARPPREPVGIHARHTAMARDGYVYMLALNRPWQEVARFIGLDEFTHGEFEGPGGPQPWDEMAASFHAAIARKTKYEWFAAAAEQGWTFAPVEDPEALLKNPQSQARQAFDSVERDGEQYWVPSLPFKFIRSQ